jgi:hypothetical protein
MGEAKRRREATRSEKRGASVKRRLGSAELNLCIFPLIEIAIQPPKSPDDLLAMWRLQAGLVTLERKARGELYCLHCDEAIAVDPPPVVGFLKPDDPESELCCFSLCESCFLATDTRVELTAMVAAAFDGTIAPDPVYN